MSFVNRITKKSWFIPFVTMSVFLVFYGFVNIDIAEASLRSRVTAGNGDELLDSIDKAGSSLVDIARQAAIIVCVLIAIWTGYALWVKKTAESWADVKGRLLALAGGLLFVFFAEKIIGTMLKIFGYEGTI